VLDVSCGKKLILGRENHPKQVVAKKENPTKIRRIRNILSHTTLLLTKKAQVFESLQKQHYRENINLFKSQSQDNPTQT
jgi:hypothetical protein